MNGFVCVCLVLLMYVISQVSAVPVTLPCEGKVQLDGSYVFGLQPIITDLLNDPSCEVHLITEVKLKFLVDRCFWQSITCCNYRYKPVTG